MVREDVLENLEVDVWQPQEVEKGVYRISIQYRSESVPTKRADYRATLSELVEVNLARGTIEFEWLPVRLDEIGLLYEPLTHEEDLEIPAGEYREVGISLEPGEQLLYIIHAEQVVNVLVLDPQGQEIRPYLDQTGNILRSSVVAQNPGHHTVAISNDSSNANATLDLRYGVSYIPAALMPTVTYEPDKLALEALYRAANGDNWENNFNWLSDAPLWKWAGVTINAEGRVGELDLSWNKMAGEIPPELGNLSEMQRLHLDENRIIGCIPKRLEDVPDNDLHELELPYCAG